MNGWKILTEVLNAKFNLLKYKNLFSELASWAFCKACTVHCSLIVDAIEYNWGPMKASRLLNNSNSSVFSAENRKEDKLLKISCC